MILDRESYILESLGQAEYMMRNIASRYRMEYEDLYQEAYIYARSIWSKIVDKHNPRAYLHRCLRNHLISLATSVQWTFSLDAPLYEVDEVETSIDTLEAPSPVVTAHLIQEQDRKAEVLYAALSRLPLDEQEYLCHAYQINAFVPIAPPIKRHATSRRIKATRTRDAVRKHAYRALRRDAGLCAALGVEVAS